MKRSEYNNKNAMAETVSVLVSSMKDFGLSDQQDAESVCSQTLGDNDDAGDKESDGYEERFRVDRKKLEQMLQSKFTDTADSCILAPDNLSMHSMVKKSYISPQSILLTCLFLSLHLLG